jgi:L-threonylcarbamoyladenylate synthase
MLSSLPELIIGIRQGQIGSFPTDTVPALAVLPENSPLIFAAKERSQDKPLILMGSDAASLWSFVKGSPEEREIWQQVAEQYWPGALTLVLPASDRVPVAMNPTDPTTIGLRVPNCAIAQTILSQTGPLATTSANRSGEPPLLTMAEIDRAFPEVLTLIDEESSAISLVSGTPSTVAKWNSNGWEILRSGAVKLE